MLLLSESMTKDHFRAHGRRQVNLSATLRHRAGSWRKRARVVDLSLGGVCLETSEPVEPGIRVTVEVLVPTLWDPLVLEGRVAWVRRRNEDVRMGIELQHRATGPLFALVELLAAHAY